MRKISQYKCIRDIPFVWYLKFIVHIITQVDPPIVQMVAITSRVTLIVVEQLYDTQELHDQTTVI